MYFAFLLMDAFDGQGAVRIVSFFREVIFPSQFVSDTVLTIRIYYCQLVRVVPFLSPMFFFLILLIAWLGFTLIRGLPFDFDGSLVVKK